MEEKREKNYRLINMEDVEAREVNWLWYPYIPYGKLTIVQGVVLQILSSLNCKNNGGLFPGFLFYPAIL